jgi:hypothetical protein
MKIEFSPRLNFLTGDNGLGKSFILDIAWWALTRTWASHPARPSKWYKKPSISIAYRNDLHPIYEYKANEETWSIKTGAEPFPNYSVIYAQVDGGFSIFDPIRNWIEKRGQTKSSAFL